jgi:hypothetical protein
VIGKVWPGVPDSSAQVSLECSAHRRDRGPAKRLDSTGRAPVDVPEPATSPVSALGPEPAAAEFSDPLDLDKVAAEYNDRRDRVKTAVAFSDPLDRVKMVAEFDLIDPEDPAAPDKTAAEYAPIAPGGPDKMAAVFDPIAPDDLADPVKTAAVFDLIAPDDLTVDPDVPMVDPDVPMVDLVIAGTILPIDRSLAAKIAPGATVPARDPAAIGGRRGTAAKIVPGARVVMAIGDGMTTVIKIIGTMIGTISGMTITSTTTTTTGITAVGATTGRTTGMCPLLLALALGV